MHSPLLKTAVQDMFTAGLRLNSYTYGKLLFIHVCSDPTPRHCSTVQGKMHSPLLSAAVQDRFTAGLCLSSYLAHNLHCLHGTVCSFVSMSADALQHNRTFLWLLAACCKFMLLTGPSCLAGCYCYTNSLLSWNAQVQRDFSLQHVQVQVNCAGLCGDQLHSSAGDHVLSHCLLDVLVTKRCRYCHQCMH